jgi:hypothetical protein
LAAGAAAMTARRLTLPRALAEIHDTIHSNVATKADVLEAGALRGPDMQSALRDLERQLTIRVAIMLIVAVGVLLAGLGTTVSIILNRLPAPTGPATHAGFVVLAGERPFDWDRYHERQDACAEKDRIAAQCVQGVAFCDELALRQATRACSPFTGEH